MYKDATCRDFHEFNENFLKSRLGFAFIDVISYKLHSFCERHIRE